MNGWEGKGGGYTRTVVEKKKESGKVYVKQSTVDYVFCQESWAVEGEVRPEIGQTQFKADHKPIFFYYTPKIGNNDRSWSPIVLKISMYIHAYVF